MHHQKYQLLAGIYIKGSLYNMKQLSECISFKTSSIANAESGKQNGLRMKMLGKMLGEMLDRLTTNFQHKKNVERNVW